MRLVNLKGAEPLSDEEMAWTKRASVFSKSVYRPSFHQRTRWLTLFESRRSLAGKKRHIAFEHDHDVVVNMQIDDLDAEIPELCQCVIAPC